ncbi:hypothetical protein M0811_02357 [Anaeramoeba ignava]|uniref:PH domain-containing protein n=1 Tax=Anaeramoeba ignava TaxID=1746090 RepID=A0A9Q0R8J9_ANAIG|nr:hypothetical protein M0811_02357 [Anaeramoeba ignava]
MVDIIHSGWLQKRGERNSALKTRWFILRTSGDIEYRKKPNTSILGIIKFSLIISTFPVNEKTKKIKEKFVGRSFKIMYPKREYFLVAENATIRDRWVYLINDFIYRQNKKKISQDKEDLTEKIQKISSKIKKDQVIEDLKESHDTLLSSALSKGVNLVEEPDSIFSKDEYIQKCHQIKLLQEVNQSLRKKIQNFSLENDFENNNQTFSDSKPKQENLINLIDIFSNLRDLLDELDISYPSEITYIFEKEN